MLNRIIRYFLENRVVTLLLLVLIIVWGISTSPFNWHGGIIPRNPIPVDAIPDIGDNQQIVATEWMGRSPKDIQDQITYPLTTSLLGIPGVKTIRSSSMFGMSFIYIIFDDDIEFYWSRSRHAVFPFSIYLKKPLIQNISLILSSVSFALHILHTLHSRIGFYVGHVG